MKKLLSIILLALLLTGLLACNKEAVTIDTQSTTASSTQGTTASSTTQTTVGTQAPVTGTEPEVKKPDIFPEKPAGLTEKTFYSYSENGLAVIKRYFDKNGTCLEEHTYELDEELSILFPTIKVKYTLGSDGGIESAEVKYSSHPIHGIPQRTIILQKSAAEDYDYEVLNEEGKVVLYLNGKLEHQKGTTAEIKMYARNGKPAGSQKSEYDQNGVCISLESYDASGALTYTCKHNENGNLISADRYDEENNIAQIVITEYFDNGILKTFTSKQINSYGIQISKTLTFRENGDLAANGDIRCSVVNGIPKQSFSYNLTYNFDSQGYVTKCEKRMVTTGNIAYINYTYDSQGRIASIKSSSNTGNMIAKDSYTYTYEKDGGYTLEYTNNNGVLSYVIKVNPLGLITWNAEMDKTGVRSKKTYSYDSFGALLDYQEYERETLTYSEAYKYDEKGNVTEKLLTNHKENRKYRATHEYFSDGGYCMTEFKDSEINYTKTTYNANDKITQIIKTQNEHTQITDYEYHSNGKTAHIKVTYDGETQSETNYNEDGTISKLLVTDENGKKVLSEYIRENGVPVRINTYEDGTFAGHTELEYFKYTSDNENTPKKITVYDAEGKILAYTHLEFDDKTEAVISSKVLLGDMLTETVYNGKGTEEDDIVSRKVYVGGTLYSEEHTEFDENGYRTKKTQTIGTTYIETEYTVFINRGYSQLAVQKTYENGELISVYKRISDNTPPTYEEEFYEGGVLTHKYVYDAHSEELVVQTKVLYEYHENGKLFCEKIYNVKKGTDYLVTTLEYDENGIKTKREILHYTTSDTVHKKTVEYYDAKGLVTRYLRYDGSRQLSLTYDTTYEHHENGKVSKEIELRYSMEKIFSTTKSHYDEEGRQTYYFIEFNNGRTEETITEFDENGEMIKNEVYKNGVLYQKSLNEFDENGNIIYELEQSGETKVETRYEYYENGHLKEKIIYVDGELTERETYENK